MPVRPTRWILLTCLLLVLLGLARTSGAPYPPAGPRLQPFPAWSQVPRIALEPGLNLRWACENCPADLIAGDREVELDAPTVGGGSGEGSPMNRVAWFQRQRAYPQKAIPAGALQRAYREVQRQETSRRLQSVTETWVPLGPTRIHNGQPPCVEGPRISVSGRASALALAPNNPDIVYLGSANGGVWRSTDGGRSWTPLMQNEASLSIGALAIDPTNPNVIYAGTGEGKLSTYYGAGLLKSTDGGASWRLLGENVFANRGITRLVIDPSNPNNLYASTTPGLNYRSFLEPSGPPTGLYKSTDGGVSWTRLGEGIGWDVILVPGSPRTVYVALGIELDDGSWVTGIFKSTDAGVNWTRVLYAQNPVGYRPPRVVLSISPARPNRVYAGFGPLIDERGQVGSNILVSEDGGQNWEVLNLDGYCGEQCIYDNIVVADPTNANILYAGGVYLFKSTDRGANWTHISCNSTSSIHADQHALVVHPSNPNIIYSGNDGGVFKSTDGGRSWISLNAGLELTQFVGIALHPTDPNIILGGTQDNGTNLFNGQAVWDHVQDGDGGFTAIDPVNPNTMYSQYYNLSGSQISPTRSDAGGRLDTFQFLGTFRSNNQIVEDHGFDLNDRVLFYAPIALDPRNPSILYYGTHRLYKSTNRGDVWTPITGDLTRGRGAISTIAIAPSNPRVIYVGTSDGNIAVTSDGSSFRNAARGIPRRFVSRIVVHPTDPNTAWAGLSGFNENTPGAPGHVFKTTDGGRSWRNVSQGLPNVPVNALTLDPTVPDRLYAATDVGVYRSTDGGATWSRYSAGLPNVVVFDLAFNPNTRRLVAATYGRGVWQISLPGAGPTPTPTHVGPSPTPTPTRTADVTPTPTRTGVACQERIGNGGFETGRAAPWVEFSALGEPLIYHRDDLPIAPHGEDHAVWLGGYENARDELYQTVSMPADATSATLSYWWYMGTDETGSPSDFLKVQIRSVGRQVLETLETISNRSQSGVWVQSRFDLSAYADQTIQVVFLATTDPSLNTNFFLDDVSLETCAGEATPVPGMTPSPTVEALPSPTATPTSQPGVVRIYISPPDASVSVDSTTQIEVWVENVTDLYGYEIHLSFDPAVVQVEGSPQAGNIFAGKTVQTFLTAVDNGAGTVDYAVALQSAAGGVSGSGSLMRLTFRGVAQGNSPLTLGPATTLADSLANLIPTTLQSGNLTVTTAQGRILGQIRLQGRTDFSGISVQVNGASTTTDATGHFALSGVSGQVDVEARMPGYLFARRENVTVSTGDVTLPAVTLLGGDANQDGRVNVQDGVIVSRNFGENVPPADPQADINGDGRIGVQDGVLVARNFSATAPVPWPAAAVARQKPRKDGLEAEVVEVLARAALRLRAGSRALIRQTATAATLRFDPSPLFIPAGSSASVAVRLEGVTDLYGFELHFTFDPSRVQVEGKLQPGTLFAGQTTQVFQNAVDNEAGRVDYAVSLQGVPAGVSGSGTLVHLTLRGISEGSGDLVFTPDTHLSDSQVNLIPVALESGVVTVGSGQVATPTPSPTPTPTVTPPPGVAGIFGQVTVLAAPTAGIPVALFSYDGRDLNVVAVTQTDAAGRYQFTDAPSLPAGHLYFVGFANIDDDPRYLTAIIGPLIESYTAGMTIPGGALEIANVALGEPDEDQAALLLPVVFRWTARDLAGDWYYLHLFGADYIPDTGFHTPDWVEPGGVTVDSYTLSHLPGGFEVEKQYFWEVYVWRDDTLGVSLETHRVILAMPPARLYLPLILR